MRVGLRLLRAIALGTSTVLFTVAVSTTTGLGQGGDSSNTPPTAAMEKFYGYLNGSYSLYLGDDRGACSYHVDPAGVRPNGGDRFFLAKISRGKAGTACRGVLEFRIMQADCKAKKLYGFTREQNSDPRVAGWERFETVLYNPENQSQLPQSQKALGTICR
jgi:hypothetical protein